MNATQDQKHEIRQMSVEAEGDMNSVAEGLIVQRDEAIRQVAAAPEMFRQLENEIIMIENLLGDIVAGRPLNRDNIERGLRMRVAQLRQVIAGATSK